MPKVWYCDKCASTKVVFTKSKGVRCATCGGKVYLAEHKKYKPSPNFLYDPKTNMIKIKNFTFTCPKCKITYKFDIDFSIKALKNFFKEEGN